MKGKRAAFRHPLADHGGFLASLRNTARVRHPARLVMPAVAIGAGSSGLGSVGVGQGFQRCAVA
jgi:hypothetical protein